MRRSASSGGIPRASRRSSRSFRRRLDDDHRVVLQVAACDSTSSGHVVDDDAVRGRRRDLPEELLADRRVRDRLEVLLRVVVRERRLGELAPGRARRRAGGSRAEPLDELRERRRPRFHHLPGDQVGVDHDRAPLRQHLGDGRLPRPDPASQPHHQHGPGAYASRPAPPSRVWSARIACGDAAPPHACGRTAALHASERAYRPTARAAPDADALLSHAARTVAATSLDQEGRHAPVRRTAHRTRASRSTDSSRSTRSAAHWTHGDDPAPVRGRRKLVAPRVFANPSVAPTLRAASARGGPERRQTARSRRTRPPRSCGSFRFPGRRCSRSRRRTSVARSRRARMHRTA